MWNLIRQLQEQADLVHMVCPDLLSEYLYLGSLQIHINFQSTAKDEMSKMMINGETKDSKSVGVKIATKNMTGEQTFHCNPQQLYRALTDKEVYM